MNEHTATLRGPITPDIVAALCARNEIRLAAAQAALGDKWLCAKPVLRSTTPRFQPVLQDRLDA